MSPETKTLPNLQPNPYILYIGFPRDQLGTQIQETERLQGKTNYKNNLIIIFVYCMFIIEYLAESSEPELYYHKAPAYVDGSVAWRSYYLDTMLYRYIS
jgi:hypothetical protein